MNPSYNFEGQVALITGAASGMGRATAKAFSQAGAAVVLVDRDSDKLQVLAHEITTAGRQVITLAGDVSDESLAKRAVGQAVADFGRLDMAYNSAGILGPMCPLSEETAGRVRVDAMSRRTNRRDSRRRCHLVPTRTQTLAWRSASNGDDSHCHSRIVEW